MLCYIFFCLRRSCGLLYFGVVSPYQDLEKATVLQECRVFSESNVVTNNPRRCCQLITKLLFILTQGETFSSSETTEVSFRVLKQSRIPRQYPYIIVCVCLYLFIYLFFCFYESFPAAPAVFFFFTSRRQNQTLAQLPAKPYLVFETTRLDRAKSDHRTSA